MPRCVKTVFGDERAQPCSPSTHSLTLSLSQSLPVTLCALVWVPNSQRPRRPAAHLPLKGRGTDFQVVPVGTHEQGNGLSLLSFTDYFPSQLVSPMFSK